MLTFTVSQQILTRTDTDRVIADSQNHVKAKFTLDEEWQGLTVTAVFQNGNVTRALYDVTPDTAVTVPWELLHPGNMHVYLEGYDGELRLTTARLDRPVRIHPSGRIPWTFTRNEPSPSLYEQLVSACRELKTLIFGRVPVMTDASCIYATDSSGQPTALPYTDAAGVGHVVVTTSIGTIASAEPLAGNDAATKNYVDCAVPPRESEDMGKVLSVDSEGHTFWDSPKVSSITDPEIDNVVYCHSHGVDSVLSFVSASPVVNSIVRRDGSGRVKVASPTSNLDAVNKIYVDNRFAALDTLTVSGIADVSRPNTTMQYSNGIQISYGEVRLNVSDATELITLGNGKKLFLLTLSPAVSAGTSLFAEDFYSVSVCHLTYHDSSGDYALSLTGSANTISLTGLSGVFMRASGTAALNGRLYYTVIGRWKQ